MKVTKTPKPSEVSVEFVEPPPNSPSAISAMPITSSIVAMIVSRRETRPSVGAADSRSAAIGGHARRPERRPERRDDGHDGPDDERDDDRRATG